MIEEEAETQAGKRDSNQKGSAKTEQTPDWLLALFQQRMRRKVRLVRDADYTAVCENGSISARTAMNSARCFTAMAYAPASWHRPHFLWTRDAHFRVQWCRK